MNLFVSRVFAKTLLNTQNGDVATIQSLETLFGNALGAIVSLAGVALFLMFIVGGFSFLFSGGDQKKLEQAKGTLTSAIIGLVVIIAAYLILRLISTMTGLPEILKFDLGGTSVVPSTPRPPR